MKPSLSLLFTAILFGLVLGGCDVTGPEDTVIFNASSPIPPKVKYRFVYDTNGSGPIEVQSEGTDNLGSILSKNGFSRADVVSARVDSVKLESFSPKTASIKRYVFDYLRGATVYFSPDAEGPRIAEASFQTTESVLLRVRTADVTERVKRGPTNAFLRLDTTNDVPDRRDKVDVTVYFRIEVQGV